jgi:hypothetical protein
VCVEGYIYYQLYCLSLLLLSIQVTTAACTVHSTASILVVYGTQCTVPDTEYTTRSTTLHISIEVERQFRYMQVRSSGN